MKIVGWNQDELTFDVRIESKEVDPRPYGGKLMGSGSRQAEYTFTAESVCLSERTRYHDDDDEQENRMRSIGRVSANLTNYCALKQLFSARGWSGYGISGEARVVENEDRNGPVANGGWGMGEKRGTIIRRGEEKKEMMGGRCESELMGEWVSSTTEDGDRAWS
jgi:hypothetical protein